MLLVNTLVQVKIQYNLHYPGLISLFFGFGCVYCVGEDLALLSHMGAWF